MTCQCSQLGGDRRLPLGSASVPLLSGDAGIAQTIRKIRELVDEGVKSAAVNKYAIESIRRARSTPYDAVAQAYAIWERVASPSEFTFVNDPWGPFGPKETLRPADVLLANRGGDCDDLNGILIPSLMGTIGLPTRLVTVATDPDEPNTFSHIYAEVEAPAGSGRWYAVDAARPDAEFGRAPENVFRRQVWALDDSSNVSSMMGIRHSLAGYTQVPAYKMQPGAMGGRRALGALGDDSTTAQDISAITTGTANIVLATEASPQNIYGVVNTSPGLATLSPAGYSPYATSAGYINTPFGVMQEGSALLLGVGALIGLVALMSAFRK